MVVRFQVQSMSKITHNDDHGLFIERWNTMWYIVVKYDEIRRKTVMLYEESYCIGCTSIGRFARSQG